MNDEFGLKLVETPRAVRMAKVGFDLAHNMIMRVLALMILLGCFSFVDRSTASESSQRIIIPVGSGEKEVCWSVWDDGPPRRYEINAFMVDSVGNLYLQDECDNARTGRIKVYSASGTYLRGIGAHGCGSLFLWDTLICGQRPVGKKDVEIVVFSASDGNVLRTTSLPSTPGATPSWNWRGYKLKDGKVYYLLKGTMGFQRKAVFDLRRLELSENAS